MGNPTTVRQKEVGFVHSQSIGNLVALPIVNLRWGGVWVESPTEVRRAVMDYFSNQAADTLWLWPTFG